MLFSKREKILIDRIIERGYPIDQSQMGIPIVDPDFQTIN